MTTRDVSPLEPRSRERREVVRLLRRIQELSLEIADLRHREGSARDLDAKEHGLDQLRWRLAALARRSASDDLDAAA
jgi:hypothetical protein